MTTDRPAAADAVDPQRAEQYDEYRVMFIGPGSRNPRMWDSGRSREWAAASLHDARDVEQYGIAGERVTDWWIEARRKLPDWERIEQTEADQ